MYKESHAIIAWLFLLAKIAKFDTKMHGIKKEANVILPFSPINYDLLLQTKFLLDQCKSILNASVLISDNYSKTGIEKGIIVFT